MLTIVKRVPSSENEFTELGGLRRLPRLIFINRGGCFRTTTSANVLKEADALGQPSWLIELNRGGRFMMPASVKD